MKNTKIVSRHLTLFALLVGLGLPSVGAASTPAPAPIPAGDGDPCGQAIVALELDVAAGLVYRVTPTGRELLVDNELDLYFGSLDRVVIDLELTVGEWEVEVSPQGAPTEVRYTRGGALRHVIETGPDEYLLSFTELSASASAMTMGPLLPDVIINPIPDCPSQ
ncbi:hypothetical protein ENSA5_02450 [Enhygromyxa salina]|uniref:DUF2846 domain-containing protein n=1 Tax=Enhygromyxa salina TaxID=215803 RepID=A0A2S9YK05_9BACT|nr:hypothetical protein [Enhygromyxa salina]PRQ05425.1 hypothetical protein ENSA5_02450 [Enhygromyxa salina]